MNDGLTRGEVTRRGWLGAMGGGVAGAWLARGAARARAQGAPRAGGTVRVGLQSTRTSPDPHRHPFAFNNTLILTAESLTDVSDRLEAAPLLAEAWEVSGDGREWQFRLRGGVRFHNGRELTSADVKANVERIADAKTGSALGRDFREIAEVKTPAATLVRLVTKERDPSLPVKLTNLAILAPEHFGELATRVVGTGPFAFAGAKDETITLRRFAGYWQPGLPRLDEVVFVSLLDSTVRLTALRTGEIDLMDGVPFGDIQRLKERGGIELGAPRGGGGQYGLRLNAGRPPFNDVRVRQAVALGVDRDEWVQGLTWGHGETVNQPIARSSPWYVGDLPPRRRDVARAKAILGQAGHPQGFETSIVTYTVYPLAKQLAEMAAAQLAEVGIRCRVEVLDSATATRRVRVQRDYALAALASIMFLDPDEAYGRYLTSDSPQNDTGYRNERVDRLLHDGRVQMDPGKRARLYSEAVHVLDDEVPWVYGVNAPPVQAWRPRLRGYAAHPHGGRYFSALRRAWVEG